MHRNIDIDNEIQISSTLLRRSFLCTHIVTYIVVCEPYANFIQISQNILGIT